MSIGLWLAVGTIGGVGAILRFLIDKGIGSRVGGEFPWGTFAVNISGSFILGILVGVALTGSALLLAGTATIGSYTTFSTWMLETHRLGQNDDRRPLVLNIVASLVVGLGAAELGRIIGGAL